MLFQYAQQEQLLRQQTRAVGVLVREKLFPKVRFPKISQGRTRKITTVFVYIRHLSRCLFDTKLKNILKDFARIEYITKRIMTTQFKQRMKDLEYNYAVLEYNYTSLNVENENNKKYRMWYRKLTNDLNGAIDDLEYKYKKLEEENEKLKQNIERLA